MKILWLYRVNADLHSHITTWRETYNNLKKDHKIHYIFPVKKEKKGFCDNITFLKLPAIPFVKRFTYILISFIAFVKLNKKEKPDLVILDIWSYFFSFIYVFQKQRPKVIVDTRTAEYNNTVTNSSIANSFLRWLSKSMLLYNRKHHDGITYISEALKKQFEEDFDIKPHPNYCVWPSGVDLEHFNPAASVTRRKDHPFRLFFHGSLNDNRGLAETIKAMALLKKEGIETEFVTVGDGNYVNYLKELAKEEGVSGQVQFLPSTSYKEIPPFIEEADLCMMAYPLIEYWEGNVPLKILEYMAMGKMVLCSGLRVFKNITEEKEFAVFIENNSPEEVAEGIKRAIAKKEDARQLGATGREVVSRRFSWQSISNNLNRFIMQLHAPSYKKESAKQPV